MIQDNLQDVYHKTPAVSRVVPFSFFQKFPKELDIVCESPWFRNYKARNWYFDFYINYCVYRVFEDNYRNKCVGVVPFLDAMNTIMGWDRRSTIYMTAYMAAKEIFTDEKSLITFIRKRVFPYTKKFGDYELSLDDALELLTIGFNSVIDTDYQDVYDRCEEKFKAEMDKSNGNK